MNLRMFMIKNTNKMQPQTYFETYQDYFKPKTLSITTRLCAQRNCAAQISVRCRGPRVRPSACSPVLLLLVLIWDALPGLPAGVETVTLASPQHISDSRKICFIHLPFIKLAVTISCGCSMIRKGRVLGSMFHTWKPGYVMSRHSCYMTSIPWRKAKFTKEEANGVVVEEN